ncbi:MAG: hypothetical protein MPJ50_01890 [Pirellulales bacterium]|nr:hypothetical protein [Pirellulales bacterium]
MADTLAVDLKTSLTWLFTETGDLTAVHDNSALEYSASFADGTAANQADQLWYDKREVAASFHDDLDLTTLPRNLFGNALTIGFVQVKAILLVNLSTTSGEVLRVGGAGAGNAFATPFAGDVEAQVEAPPDSPLLLVNRGIGWTVTAGTGDILRVENTVANPVSYHITIIGTSA